jgi:dihydrofolate reductase
MSRLVVYNSVSLDGYFAGVDGDLGWSYEGSDDSEWYEFVTANATGGAQSGGRLLFGRVTYEMMADYWPTPAAAEAHPGVARSMNAMQKIVFSRTLKKASWEHTRLTDDAPAAEVRKLKAEPGDIVIFGSGSIVARLADEGLIDEYQIVVCPIVLGRGRTMFEGLNEAMPLTLVRSRTFPNGKVFLSYVPAKRA